MRCGRPAVVFRPYSGESLCEDCFCLSIEDKVRRAISKWKMLQPEDRIAVAHSGGKDSTVLLTILVKMQRRFPQSEIIAVTLDEGIPGDSGNRMALITRTTRRLGVKHVVSSFRELFSVTLEELAIRARELDSPLSPCAYCSVLRRRGLNIMARRIGADKLALGHNLDDEVQSMLMNLLRGDLHRLSRFTPHQRGDHRLLVPRIKPLYHIPEQEIALYTQYQGLPYYQDPCPYREQSLRSEVRRWLNNFEKHHPGTKYNLSATLSKIASTLRAQPQGIFKECRICGEPTSREVCALCQHLTDLGIRLQPRTEKEERGGR